MFDEGNYGLISYSFMKVVSGSTAFVSAGMYVYDDWATPLTEILTIEFTLDTSHSEIFSIVSCPL